MRTTTLSLAWAMIAALGIAGCYESLTSIATPDKLVFVDGLSGTYDAVGPGTGRLVIERGKDKAYAYRQYDEKGSLANRGTLWIVRLGDNHFYQISVDGYATTDGRPVYAVGRLDIEGKSGARTLSGYAFKSPESLFGDALVKTESYERMKGGERKTGRALSMPPEKLQTYLAARSGEMTQPTLRYRQTAAER